jgi:hypothetical protein
MQVNRPGAAAEDRPEFLIGRQQVTSSDGFDRDSQYLNGISGAPFLLLVSGMKGLSCLGAWIAADPGHG